ncbi:hypothetical protein JCM3765_000613 [Sporobolomyces pararoseus]
MYHTESRPSTATSSVDLTTLASAFPLPPFSPASKFGSSPPGIELRQTSPPWTAYRQTLPSTSPSPPLRVETPEEYLLPHSEYFAATSTPRRGGDNSHSTLFEFDEFDDQETPALSSSSYSSRSRTSPFPSPTASTSSSIDSELYNSPGKDKQDVGLGLWLEEQERKAAQMERALSEFSLSASSLTSTTSYSSSRSNEDHTTLPRFDPFGSASPVLVQRASYIKFEQAPAPPVQQRVHRPVPVRPSYSPPQQHSPPTSLLPAAIITSSTPSQRIDQGPSPFSSARPSYVAPGPDAPSSNVPLSPHDLAQVAALHNGRVPTLEQMAPIPQLASNGLPPPIVNTGNQGRMVPQLGDWKCGTCTFVNWRRRKVCMRCFPFASNDIGQSFAAQSQRAAYLASTPMTPSRSAPSFPQISPTSSVGSSSFFSPPPPPPRKMSLPLPSESHYHYHSPSQFSPESYFATSSPQYSLPPLPSPQHRYQHQQQQHQQPIAPPFPPRSPCEDIKMRRRIGGVISYSGIAY